MRGQPRLVRPLLILMRIIPDRAGPTRDFSATECPGTDHPRSCGANGADERHVGCQRGSSPLVRGQRVHRYQLRRELRIIPARAGPTNIKLSGWYDRADHPRSCGANLIANIRSVYGDGSSPLVRGQPLDVYMR